MGNMRCATAGTGTASSPLPRSPSASMRTCSEPNSISHRLPVKNCGSSLERCGRLRRRRVLRARSGELHGCDANFANVGRFAADIDLRDAGNHLRHAHGDEEAIWPGIAFEENVGAANVRGNREASGRQRAERMPREEEIGESVLIGHDQVYRRISRTQSPPGQPQARAQDRRERLRP